MSGLDPRPDAADEEIIGAGGTGPEEQSGRRHRWMMLACCVPMILVVAGLVATGAAGTGAVVFAVVCVGLMVFVMPGHKH